MKAVLVGTIHEKALQLLKENVAVTQVDQTTFDQNTYDCEVLVVRTFTPVTKEVLERLPKLKYLISCSVGLDNIDRTALKEKGVELIAVPGTNANSVAEHVVYLLFSLLREDSKRPFAELEGKTLGILGFGFIGKVVARKALGFGVKVVAYDVVAQDPAVLKELCVEMVDLPTLLTSSDVVTVHVPLIPPTRGMINKEVFEQMKEGSFFINTSREEVVDEEALIAAQSKFRGIGLDVGSEHLLRSLKGNVVITDHVAAQGEQSFERMGVVPISKFVEQLGK